MAMLAGRWAGGGGSRECHAPQERQLPTASLDEAAPWPIDSRAWGWRKSWRQGGHL